MTTETVRQASALPDMNHRDPAYLSLVQETKHHLRHMYPGLEDWAVALVGGSGTAAVEAMVTSCVGDGPVLIVANGYYSDRIDQIFHIHGIPCKTLSFPWLGAWDLEMIRSELASTAYEAVFAVHNETTTGRLNPVAELGRLAHEHSARCFVDAMSSFGADPLDVSHLDAVCSSANKCIHGLPGVSFVMLAPDLACRLDDFPRRTYYLSLAMMVGDEPALTPPVPALQAFRQALVEMLPGYAMGRQKVYESRVQYLREAMKGLGLATPIPVTEASRTLVMATLPDRTSYKEWFDMNYSAGYVLYGCKGVLADRFFQVSVMGALPDHALAGWHELASNLLDRSRF